MKNLLKQKTLIALALLSLAGGAAFGVIRTAEIRQRENSSALFSAAKPQKTFLPSAEEIADLTRPGIVRIVTTIKGDAKIPALSIDPNTLEVSLDQKKILSVPIEYEIVGAGFFVTPDGVIATNAHVVSREIAKYFAISRLVSLALDKDFFLGPAKDVPVPASDAGRRALRKKVLDAQFEKIAAESEFTLESDIRVLNPVHTSPSLTELARGGMHATILREEPGFLENGRDIAIIQIEGRRYPAIPLDADARLPVARNVFAFEFPGADEPGGNDPFAAEFAAGAIRAVTDAPAGDFKTYALGLLATSESSGGPLVDERGIAAGILAFPAAVPAENPDSETPSALPSSILAKTLSDAGVAPARGAYYKNLLAGIQALREKHCKIAEEKFNAARETNGAFLSALTIKKYADECAALVAAGESADSRFDAIFDFFKTVGPLVWIIGGIAVFGILAASILFVIFRKRIWKHEEKTGRVIGVRIARPETPQAASRGEFLKKREPAYLSFLTRREAKKDTAHSEAEFAAIAYAKNARATGFSDAEIVKALRDAGWNEISVNRIMLLARVR